MAYFEFLIVPSVRSARVLQLKANGFVVVVDFCEVLAESFGLNSDCLGSCGQEQTYIQL